MKNIRMFYLKNCHFLGGKFSVYLNRHVFVMWGFTVQSTNYGHIESISLPNHTFPWQAEPFKRLISKFDNSFGRNWQKPFLNQRDLRKRMGEDDRTQAVTFIGVKWVTRTRLNYIITKTCLFNSTEKISTKKCNFSYEKFWYFSKFLVKT